MFSTLKKATIAGAAVALASLGLISASASALPPGTASSGSVTVTPPSGNSSTAVNIAPPSPSFCQGDTATGGYFYQTFIVSSTVDPATLTYDSNGPVAQGSAIVYPLFQGGTPIVAGTLSIGPGQIIPNVTPYDFSVFTDGVLPPGLYNIGYACSKGGVTTKFWSSQITITADAADPGPAKLDYALVTGPPPDVPEVPFGVLLPASAIGLLGGATLVARKRRSKAMA